MDVIYSPFSVERSSALFSLAGYNREKAVEIQRGKNWLSKLILVSSLRRAALKYKEDADDLNRAASIIFGQIF